MFSLLLISRNRRVRRTLKKSLPAGYRLTITHSIFGAFRLLLHHRFESVLVHTSHHDAYASTLLKWLSVKGILTNVIVLLGPAAGMPAQRLKSLGAAVVLTWPGHSDRLLRAVDECTLLPLRRSPGNPASTRKADIHAVANPRAPHAARRYRHHPPRQPARFVRNRLRLGRRSGPG